MYILVTEQTFRETSYNVQSGTKRRLRLAGKIDDSEQRSTFHEKSIDIRFGSPSDMEWLKEVRKFTGEPEAIGCLDVRANIESEKYELYGEEYENEPLGSLIYLNQEAFEAICSNLADFEKRIFRIKLELSGAALPETGSIFVFLSDLNTTTKQTYAITCIEISDTILKEV